MAELALIAGANVPDFAPTGNANTDSRLRKYAQWLMDTGGSWYAPNLAAYRDAMLDGGKARSTVSANLSSIRAAYRRLMRNRDAFYALAPDGADVLTRKAFVDELIARINNAIHPAESPVKQIVKQDVSDGEHLRLSKIQAERLLAAPLKAKGRGMQNARDAAIVALLLCTGIREAELVALNVADLRDRFGGELSLLVRDGKNSKQRLIPYGALDGCLVLVNAWLKLAGVESGAVFRGLAYGGRKLASERLSVRGVQRALARYPIAIEGYKQTVKPHDCRRTYALRQYMAGADLVAIQRNLGHANVTTTLGYIGQLDASSRRAKAVYDLPLELLA